MYIHFFLFRLPFLNRIIMPNYDSHHTLFYYIIMYTVLDFRLILLSGFLLNQPATILSVAYCFALTWFPRTTLQ